MGCRDDTWPMVCAHPGDAVSHADAIRRAFEGTLEDPRGEVAAALDALLAENQRLEHERDFLQRELGFKNTQRQEIQRLRDALAGIARWTNPKTDTLEEVIEYAREALAGDAE